MTDKSIPLGLHFGLPFDRYLADDGLGSGAVRQLARDASKWWWDSPHGVAWRLKNGFRVLPKKPEKHHNIIGHAVHKLLLEGKEAFDKEFVSGPVHDNFMSPAKKGASTKEFNAFIAGEGSGLTPLTADDYDRIVLYVDAIKRNPYLSGAFVGGQYEVSVFWEREGIRLKGRFDCLKVVQRPGFTLAANGDLKTVTNKFGEPFKKVCRADVANYDYDAQASHYLDGLSRIPQMVREHRVNWHFPPVIQIDSMMPWLERFLAPDIRFAWQWVFVQKNDMPLTHSYTMTPGFDGQLGSPIFEEGASKVNMGIQNYIDCVERFGLDKPWDFSALEPPEELVPEEMPRWYGSAR